MRTFICLSLLAAAPTLPAARADEPAAAAQAKGEGEVHFKNLELLPKDISKKELMATMKGFSKALGVRCEFCHVMKPTKDFAKETKKKDITREMMKMTRKIDEQFFTWPKAPKATCYMCHRGDEKPRFAPAGAGGEDEK